jgi:hypothetical protein
MLNTIQTRSTNQPRQQRNGRDQESVQHKKKGTTRWNLLICGPIEHGGLILGQHVAGGLSRKESFDCTNTIVKNINRWGYLFGDIKLISWTNQAELIRSEIKKLNIDIQLLEDPGREASFCGDSRVRVMTATAEGLRNSIQEDTYTLRIRSDQFFNLETMIRSHEKSEALIQKNQRELGLRLPHISALCFWLDRPYSLCNYAHAARTSDLLGFAEAQIKYRHGSALADNGWPEGDTIRKHLYSLRAELRKAGFAASQCFPALPKSLTEGSEAEELNNVPKSILKLWEFALRNIYSVAPRAATASLKWKGEKYPHPRIFGNGMRFRKCWKSIAKRGMEPIFDYCVNAFDQSSEISDTLNEDAWLLHEQEKRIQNR